MKKKFAVKLLAAALLMVSLIFADVSSSNVFAEEPSESTKDFYAQEVTDVSVYRTEGNYTYPKPTENGKEGYVFAGWYTTIDCTTAYTETALAGIQSGTAVYAKYVPAETMDVKFQVTNGTNAASEKSSLRMVSSVDTLNYQKVGFKIKSLSTGAEKTTDSTKVFKRIKSSTEGLEYGYSPIIFDTDSEYFVTATINNIKDFNKIYSVSSYWVTKDGTTVYGTARNARISDSYNKIANVPVRIYTDAETVELTDLKVTYDTEDFTYLGYETGVLSETAAATATPTDDGAGKTTLAFAWETAPTVSSKDGMLINLRFQVKDTESSNESFEVTSDSMSSGLFGYTYHVYASYDAERGADTSWYDEFKDGNEFVITTGNDLYGLAQLVNNGTDTFATDVVYLGADITINTDTFEPDADDWTTVSGNYAKWTPIGTTNAFAGTFDGQGQTISGVYYSSSDTAVYHGLFGATATGSMLQDFRLENSYLEFTGESITPIGSVAGNLGDDLSGVYSNAYVKSTFGNLGGLVGTVSTATGCITKCWFNGTVRENKESKFANYENVSGLVGVVVAGGTLTVEDSLFTGMVKCSSVGTAGGANKSITGIVGRNQGTLDINRCISGGSIYIEADGTQLTTDETSGAKGVCYYLGYTSSGSATITNSYAVQDETYSFTSYNKGTLNTNSTNYKNLLTSINSRGHLAYTNMSTLGFYDLDTNPEGNWVVRASGATLSEGIPVPKCFADNDTIDVAWYYGTENYDAGNNTFTINTVDELYAFADIVSTYPFATDTVVLGTDIVVNSGDASTWSAEVQPGRNWEPIGTETSAFAGIFDGQGHTISGIYHISSDESTNHGLFDTTAAGSKLQNFHLKESYFELIDIGNPTPMGSVAGILNGSMDGVYSDAKIVSVEGNIGGMAGRVSQASADVESTITNCWYNGEIEYNYNGVIGNDNRVGGYIGYITTGTVTISNCLKTRELLCTFTGAQYKANKAIGGMVGANAGTLTMSDIIMAGDVTARYPAEDGTWVYFEGNESSGVASGRSICLVLGHGSATLSDLYCRRTHSYTVIKGGNTASKFITKTEFNGHQAYSYTCDYDSETDTHTGLSYYNSVTNPEGVWVTRETAEDYVDGLPVPKCFADEWIDVAWYYDNVTSYTDEEAAAEGFVNPADEYIISTPEEMYGLSIIATFDTFENDKISLAKDIQMNDGSATDWANGQTEGVRVWTPIGSSEVQFVGEFDGVKHTISGVYMTTGTANAGLFGYVNGSTLKNLRLGNSYFESTIASGSNAHIGSITGYAVKGEMESIYSNAIVQSSGLRIGGLAGYGGQNTAGDEYYLNMINCWFDGEVRSDYNGASPAFGGFVGYGRQVYIDTCLCTGKIIWNKESEITADSYNTAIGGFVGTMGTSGQRNIKIERSISAPEITLNLTTTSSGVELKRLGTILGYAHSNYTFKDTYSIGTITVNYKNNETDSLAYTHGSVVGTGEIGIDATITDATTIYGTNATTLLTKLFFSSEDRFNYDEGTAYWVTTDTLPVPATLSGEP